MQQAILRHRLAYLPALVIAFLTGMATHFLARHLPRFVANYVPDTLWALWVVMMIVFLWPRLSTLRAVVYALGFAYIIEATQLYHASWIDAFRATILGHLILGDTFHWADLLCYTIGILGGALIDLTLRRRLPVITM